MYQKPVPLRKVQLSAAQQYVPGGSQTTANVAMPTYAPPVLPLPDMEGSRLPRRRDQAPRQQPMMTNEEGAASRAAMADRNSRLESMARGAQLRAIVNPMPLRMVSGPGVVPGYMPDVNAMSAPQRKLFLPEASSNDPRADAIGESIRQQTSDASLLGHTEDVNRRRQTESRGGGGMTAAEQAEYDFIMQQRRKGK